MTLSNGHASCRQPGKVSLRNHPPHRVQDSAQSAQTVGTNNRCGLPLDGARVQCTPHARPPDAARQGVHAAALEHGQARTDRERRREAALYRFALFVAGQARKPLCVQRTDDGVLQTRATNSGATRFGRDGDAPHRLVQCDDEGLRRTQRPSGGTCIVPRHVWGACASGCVRAAQATRSQRAMHNTSQSGGCAHHALRRKQQHRSYNLNI